MAHCINKFHPEFLKLVDSTNINPIILASKVSVWQEKNGLDKFPTITELNIIKPGVKELFESDSNIANQVYEALGFQGNNTVRLYRIENKNIPYDESREGIVSKKEIIGGFFTDNPNTVANYIRKNQSTEGISLVYVDVLKSDLDKYHVSKNKYAKNMDVESDNWIIPQNINRNYVDLKDLTKVTGNFMTLSKAKTELSDIINNLPKNEITPQQKQQAIQLYSQYLESLNKPNTNPVLQGNQQEQVKKFAELQERLNNKEFIEGAKTAWESTSALQELGTQEEYNDYIARVSLGILKNPSSGEYNYDSKVKDIVYHKTPFSFDKFEKPIEERKLNKLNKSDAIFFNFENKGFFRSKEGAKTISVIVNTTNNKITNENIPYATGSKESIKNLLQEDFDSITVNKTGGNKELLVFEPKQIHILGGKQDIENFAKFVSNSNAKLQSFQKSVILNNGNYLNLSEEKKKEIYKNYVNLMDRKREGKAIDYSKFNLMFDNLQVFNYKETYIFGEWDVQNNIFRGRLMSSPGIKELYGAFDDLFKTVDFVASVPEDIGAMLEKKGLYKLNVGKEYNFRGEEMIKNLYFSNKDLVEKIFKTSPEKVTIEQIKKYDTFYNQKLSQSKFVNDYITYSIKKEQQQNIKKDVSTTALSEILSILDKDKIDTTTLYYVQLLSQKFNEYIKEQPQYESREKLFKKISKEVDDIFIKIRENAISNEKFNYLENKNNELINDIKAAIEDKLSIYIPKIQVEDQNFYEKLKELGIYDYNAFRLARKIKSGKVTEEDKSSFIKEIVKNSSLNKITIDKTDVFNDPKIYIELDTELNKTLASFLSNFGITTKVLEDFQDKFNIDSFATVDILNKTIYTSKNNQTDYPQQSGKLIAYMMQHNPLVTEVMKDLKKYSIYRSLSKEELLDTVGDLIAEQLYKKTNNELPKSLLDKLKMLIHQFFKNLTTLKLNRINRNVGFIADNVLLQNQSLITSSIYKPGAQNKKTSQVNLEEALKNDKFANDIVNKMADYFILTGSPSLAEQGTVLRPIENHLHDLDWVSPFDKTKTNKLFNSLYPNNKFVREIKGANNDTNTWLIVPEGYKIINLNIIGDKKTIIGYDIVDKDNNIVSSYDKKNDEHTGKIEAKLIDIFIYNNDKTRKEDSLAVPYTLPSGKKLLLSDWRVTFKAKLGYSRLKDIWDYNRFIPNDNIFKEEIYLQQEPQSTEKPSEEINTLIKNFLAKLGISVKSVDEIRDKDGNVISATAKADMLNKIIEIIEGKASIDTLPEEAAHFFVEMLDENNPLLKEMMSKITGYRIYAETVEQYKNNSQYRNKDGTLNITKLKKEAIGKLIAQHIVSQSTTNELDAKMKDFTSWWDKVWNFIKSLFKKSQVDAFKVAAEKILKSDTSDLSQQNIQDQGEFYQLEGVEKLEQHQTDIQLDNSIDPKTGQKRHIYNMSGKDIKYSVTSKYVDAWLKRKFPNDSRDETQKKIDLLKAEYGDLIHEIMQDIIDVYVDPKTHLIRSKPAASKNKNSDTVIYKTLDRFVKDLILNYNEPGTKFMREVKIHDPIKDVAGSIDLLVITPEGTAHIYDWKSQEIKKNQNELTPYKEIMYRIQLQEYKKILQTHYDIKDFGVVRAIPIRVVYQYKGSGDTRTINGINKIEIGSFDTSKIPDDKNYLLPITLRDEKSDDMELSEYVKKLNSIMDILENKKYKTEDERRRKKIELAKYKNAVRDLQLRGDIRKFIELGNYEIGKYKKLISDKKLTEKDALESLEILSVFTNTTTVFNKYMNQLKKFKKESKNKNVIETIDEIINDYNQMNSTADVVLSDMKQAIKNMVSDFAKEKTGITNLLEGETVIGQMTGLFSSLSTIPQKSFRVFSRILSDAQIKRDNQFNKDYEELVALRNEYIDWARSKGLSDKDLFKPLLDYNENGQWTGRFLKKYKSEFYKLMNQAIQTENLNWLISNTEFDKDKYEKDLKRQKEFYDSIVYDAKDETNNKKLQALAYENWIKNHDVNYGGVNKNKQAYLNMDNYNGKKVLNTYLKPKSIWKTEKWNELEKSPIAYKTYLYFQDLVKRSNKAGVLDEYTPGFIPNLHKNKVEQFVFGGDMFSSKGIFEKLEVENSESPFAPQINPITGEVEHTIPAHFIRDIGVEKEDGTMDYSQKSMDLFRVFGVWAAQLANYESMSEIEDKSRLLLFVEKNKSHIETDKFSNPVFEGGVKKEITGNEVNSKLLSEFINYYLYNIQSGKMEDKKIKIGDKEYSGVKALGWLTRFFSLKTLALNPLSGTANFVGGTGNAFFQASKGILFNTSDWASSIYDLTKRDQIAFGLLGVADILLTDTKDSKINKLSVSSIIGANTIDKAYVMMHTSDKAVQYPIAIAIMKNHMVDENGKIVDIKTYVKAKYKYNESFYSLPASEQTIIRKKIEDEVKTLKETKSIYTTAKIVNDKIEIPGVDLQSEQWGRFRLKIKKVNKNVLGNSTRDDINSIRTSMLGSMAMQFRSWMPQMVQERFGKLKYDQDLEVHTMGKFNLFFQEMFTKRSVALLTAIVNASGTSMVEAAKQKYLLLKAEAIEKGEEFTITEGEFVDMYIGNIRSLYKEFLIILGFGALIFTALSGDDDDENKGWRTYAARAFRKYYDEFAFFYFPTSWSNLVNTPIPAVGLAEDFFRFTGALTKQGYGFVINDDDKMDDAKPAKYFFKMMPLFKEGIQIRAIFDDDFRKDWDIRFNATNR
jgi:hypothetical protein